MIHFLKVSCLLRPRQLNNRQGFFFSFPSIEVLVGSGSLASNYNLRPAWHLGGAGDGVLAHGMQQKSCISLLASLPRISRAGSSSLLARYWHPERWSRQWSFCKPGSHPEPSAPKLVTRRIGNIYCIKQLRILSLSIMEPRVIFFFF